MLQQAGIEMSAAVRSDRYLLDQAAMSAMLVRDAAFGLGDTDLVMLTDLLLYEIGRAARRAPRQAAENVPVRVTFV